MSRIGVTLEPTKVFGSSTRATGSSTRTVVGVIGVIVSGCGVILAWGFNLIFPFY